MSAIATTAAVFWLSITPQIGIDSGTPGDNVLSYGLTADLNLGPADIRLSGSKTPTDKSDSEPGASFYYTHTDHYNLNGSFYYTISQNRMVFKLGADYRLSKIDYYDSNGVVHQTIYGNDYEVYDHSFLLCVATEIGNLAGGKGPAIAAWGGVGPAYVTREGRYWVWPEYEPIEETSLVGDVITLDLGLGVSAMERICPHFGVTGTIDCRVKLTEISGEENIAESAENQFRAYIGPTLFF